MAADLALTGTDLHRVLDTLSGGLIVVAPDDHVSFCNAEFRRAFTTPTRTDWVGRPIREVIDVLALQMADPLGFRRRARALAEARVFAYEYVEAADGRTFERDFLPLFDGTEYRGHLWQYWDVTEQQAALRDRERLLRAEVAASRLGVHALRSRAVEAEADNRALVESDLLRKELLAIASHELRSPLISILNFSHLLADSAEDAAAAGDTEFDADDEIAMASAAITRNATRLLDLVDDLLLVARMDAAAHTLDEITVDLSALVMDAVQDAQALGAPDEVRVVADVAAPLEVDGDRAALVRAVANILGNAVKYSHPGGTVQVTLRREGDVVELVVSDSGIGIPSDEMGALFGQFFRASTARASGRPGTGLGLVIVRSIAEQHGGTIRLASRDGEGTVATLRLPAH